MLSHPSVVVLHLVLDLLLPTLLLLWLLWASFNNLSQGPPRRQVTASLPGRIESDCSDSDDDSEEYYDGLWCDEHGNYVLDQRIRSYGVTMRGSVPWVINWDYSHRSTTVDDLTIHDLDMALAWDRHQDLKPSRIPVPGSSIAPQLPELEQGAVAQERDGPQAPEKNFTRRVSMLPIPSPRVCSVVYRPAPPALRRLAHGKARKLYHPSIGWQTKPSDVRGLMMSRPKPRPVVDVFKDVVLNLSWDDCPVGDGTDGTVPSAETTAAEMLYLAEALVRPRRRKMREEKKMANFERERRERVGQTLVLVPRRRLPVHLVPAGDYERGGMLNRAKFALVRYKYTTMPIAGLRAGASDSVFFHPGYGSLLAPARERRGFVWIRKCAGTRASQQQQPQLAPVSKEESLATCVSKGELGAPMVGQEVFFAADVGEEECLAADDGVQKYVAADVGEEEYLALGMDVSSPASAISTSSDYISMLEAEAAMLDAQICMLRRNMANSTNIYQTVVKGYLQEECED